VPEPVIRVDALGGTFRDGVSRAIERGASS
jgi:hypothetical protein